MNPTVYCNCFVNNEPRYVQTTAVQKALMCGACNITNEHRVQLINKGFYFDDTGENISKLNTWLGDLTGLYWIWKNTQDEFVGTNQYRRFWDEAPLNTIPYSDKTIYISHHLYFPQGIYAQFLEPHSGPGLDILEYLATNKIIDFPFFDQLKTTTALSTCNMFFAHRTLFDRLCSIIFDFALEMYDGIRYMLPSYKDGDKYQKRLVAYVTERYLTIVYQNINYYFGNNVTIQPMPMFEVPGKAN